MNTARPSRSQSQPSPNAETQRNAKKRRVIELSAALCESLRLCVKSSPSPRKSGCRGAKKGRLVRQTSILAPATTRSRASIAREYHLLCFPTPTLRRSAPIFEDFRASPRLPVPESSAIPGLYFRLSTLSIFNFLPIQLAFRPLAPLVTHHASRIIPGFEQPRPAFLLSAFCSLLWLGSSLGVALAEFAAISAHPDTTTGTPDSSGSLSPTLPPAG